MVKLKVQKRTVMKVNKLMIRQPIQDPEYHKTDNKKDDFQHLELVESV